MLKIANVRPYYDSLEGKKYINQAKIIGLNGIFYY